MFRMGLVTGNVWPLLRARPAIRGLRRENGGRASLRWRSAGAGGGAPNPGQLRAPPASAAELSSPPPDADLFEKVGSALGGMAKDANDAVNSYADGFNDAVRGAGAAVRPDAVTLLTALLAAALAAVAALT